MTSDLVISNLETARNALALAQTIQQKKGVLDIAQAAKVFAKRQKLGEEIERQATAIIIEAKKQIGQELVSTPRNTGTKADGRNIGGTVMLPPSEIPTLEELGITKRESAEAQRIYQMSVDEPEIFVRVHSGELTANKAYKQIKTAKAHEAFTAQTQTKKNTAAVEVMDACQWLSSQDACDLLITDPPYMTDVEDIGAFATWLTYALDYVKDTGHAYIFIGAYPEEVKAYLNVEIPKHIELCQLLVWTYKNTLGNNPKDRYKLNYQTCLYFKGVNADNLDCPITNEQWAVQEVNAPDGRLGDRYHSWQKPMELAERFIRHSTKENDVVYDPFACTGTFLLAAAGLGRVATGCDISKDNLDIAIERGCKYA